MVTSRPEARASLIIWSMTGVSARPALLMCTTCNAAPVSPASASASLRPATPGVMCTWIGVLRLAAMRQKGRLRVGADADITIFDPATVIDRSTYREPSLSPVGVDHVIVNGVSVVANGRAVEGVAPGKEIRAPR